MWPMVQKEVRELRRDRRTVAMLIGLPLILLVVFGYAANFDVSEVRTAVYGDGAETVAGQLPDLFVVDTVDPNGDESTARQELVDGNADVAITTGGTTTAFVDGSSLFTAQTAAAALAQAPGSITVDILFNPDLKTSWVMVPALVGLIMAFIGTLITSLGLVRERQAGTIEQLAVMPFRPSDVIVGKIAPYFVLAYLDMIVVTVLGALLFGVPFQGSVVLFGVGAAVFLLAVLGLGVLISTVSQNQGQAVQTAMFVMLPQILLSGMIFPLESMPWGVRWIGYLLPLTYFVDLSGGIMLRGAGLPALWIPFAVLAVMAVVILGAAILRFRRDLAPDTGAPPNIDGSDAERTATA
ncbi:MAG: ABC transporter permease [Actinomycetota bacterium]